MKLKRRRHDPEFKARAALETLKSVKTILQIAEEYKVNPVQVSEWNKIILEDASEAFGPGSGKSSGEDFDRERKKLQVKISELTIDLDFLLEKSK